MNQSSSSRRGFLSATLGLSALAITAPTRLLARSDAAETGLQSAAATNPLIDPPGVYLNYNELPEGPCPAAQRAMAEAISHSGRYSHQLAKVLQASLAKALGVPTDGVMLYPGASGLLQAAPHAFTNPNRPLVVAAPGYEDCADGATAIQTPIIEVPLLASGAHDVHAMLKQPAGLVYICNPNNPTGTITPHAQLVTAIEQASPDTMIIVDEAYIHFSNQPSMIPLVAKHPNLIVIRTFSKVYGLAGVRCGMAIAQPQTLARYRRFAGEPMLSVFAGVASIASLKQPGLVEERKALNAQRRDTTLHWLQQQGFNCTASEANFFMVDVKQPTPKIAEALRLKGIHVSNRWKMLPTMLRVSVGTAAEMAAFRQAFAEVMALEKATLHDAA